MWTGRQFLLSINIMPLADTSEVKIKPKASSTPVKRLSKRGVDGILADATVIEWLVLV